ncbi:hypothetical protein Pmani_031234 [Petrolisthes manimaculis]|uniref:Uncharacterized protein n=1 Tax=Petrolisthes manimaculis TaxID=1843537 RepID=A0AAE1NUA2_9EUCA|nr:hypothetical protein Pmani_031234 [Petrolisthes manimaculis]
MANIPPPRPPTIGQCNAAAPGREIKKKKNLTYAGKWEIVKLIDGENYLPCTCQLWWVLESPLAIQNQMFPRHNYCVSPYAMHGKPISKVNLTNLERCPAPQELQLPSEQDASGGRVVMAGHVFVHLLASMFVVGGRW